MEKTQKTTARNTTSLSLVCLVAVGLLTAMGIVGCGGGEDDSDCNDDNCNTACVAAGYPSGVCSSGECDCLGTPADGDGDVDADGDVETPECEIGATRESYSGPAETEGIGVCQPHIEECQVTEEGVVYQIIQEEILPSEEICDGLDNDCQGPTFVEDWNRTFGGGSLDYAHSVAQTSDGGFILAGKTYSFGAGDVDAWLIRTDASGIEEWSRTFGGASWDYARSVAQTSDGGFILAGRTESFGAGGLDAWLIRTNASGIEDWSRTFGGARDDYANSVAQTSDGGFILAGYTEGSHDAWLIRTDASGIEQWSRTFGGGDLDGASSIAQTSDGGFILAGYTRESFGAGWYDDDAWLIRTDASGIEEWSRTFGGVDYDRAHSVAQTSDGGFILAGRTESFGTGDRAWLIRTDASGIEQWSRTFGGAGRDEAYAVAQTSDGGFILAGETWSSGAGREDAWLIKVCEE